MTIREALGGPWAAHWLLYLAIVPPSTLLVLLQEVSTPYPNGWWPLISATAQHLVAGTVIFTGALIARRRSAIIPIITVFTIWMVAAVMRAIVGGTVAATVTGVAPDYASRVTVWVLISAVWLAPLVYTVAQFERRRLILGALDVATFELVQEQRLTVTDGSDVQRQLRQTIAESLEPALHELQASLIASRPLLDPSAVVELSLRVSQLHDDTSDLWDSAQAPLETPPRSQASLLRAFEITPRRPWLVALLVGLATLSLLVFDVWRLFGQLAAIEVMVSTVAASVVLGGMPAAVAAIRPAALARHGQRVTSVATVLAIAVTAYLMLNSGIDPIIWHGVIVLPLLALSIVVSSATYFSAMVLADANREAALRLSALEDELDIMRAGNAQLIDRERRRVSELMHGPVHGRIAACVMALNFHATSPETGEQARLLTESVLNHLGAVSRDLTVITADVGSSTPQRGG